MCHRFEASFAALSTIRIRWVAGVAPANELMSALSWSPSTQIVTRPSPIAIVLPGDARRRTRDEDPRQDLRFDGASADDRHR